MITNFLNGYGFFLLLLLVFILGFILSHLTMKYFQRAANHYFMYESHNKLTGFQIAQKMLSDNSINDVKIIPTTSSISAIIDNFNPLTRVITLSSKVYYGSSITAQAIACHEAAHAIQYKEKYSFALLRTKIVPIVNGMNMLFFPLIFLSFLGGIFFLIILAIIFMYTFLHIITLPVEFNASNKALSYIKKSDIYFTGNEYKGIKIVLHRAAFTYVAVALGSFVYFIILLLGTRR